MFENLSDKLQRSFKTLRGEGTITDENISDALREIRLALLESDVNLAVVTELIDHIRTRVMGEKVATALSPSSRGQSAADSARHMWAVTMAYWRATFGAWNACPGCSR